MSWVRVVIKIKTKSTMAYVSIFSTLQFLMEKWNEDFLIFSNWTFLRPTTCISTHILNDSF